MGKEVTSPLEKSPEVTTGSAMKVTSTAPEKTIPKVEIATEVTMNVVEDQTQEVVDQILTTPSEVSPEAAKPIPETASEGQENWSWRFWPSPF